VAITKRRLEDAQKMAMQHQIPQVYTTQDKANLFSNPDVDAVYIATPNNCHKADTIAALEAGKHVIVEKPMALNTKECEEMIETTIHTGRKLMIAHNLRFNTTVQYIRNLIQKGGIGTLVSGTADFTSDGKKSLREWKYDKKIAGGGASFDLGVHLIDTLRYLIHPEVKQAISIKKEAILGPDPDNRVDSVSCFVLEFANDVIGRALSTFEGTRNTYLEITGTRGYVRAYEWNTVGADIRVESFLDGKLETRTIHNADNYALEIQAFADCILNDTPVPIPGSEGLINQRIIDLVNSSPKIE
jgi:predicted dehydrogenase